MGIMPNGMHCTVNGETSRVYIVRAVVHFLAIHVHLHQAAGGDFFEHETIGVDQEMPFFTGHPRRNMREHQIVPFVHGHQTVSCGQINAGLPFLLANVGGWGT